MAAQRLQDNDSSQDQKNIHGILVSYKDDQLNECVISALKRKARIRYRCMDSFSNFIAFGTSSGAIYLFKLEPITHSTCTLASMIPCDQGSIEVIRFLPNPQADDLLIIIGTSHGSLVIFSLTQYPGELIPSCNELYRAESFTNNSAIKIVEYDQDSFDQALSFAKVYICDAANRLYVLDGSSIYSSKQALKLFYSNHTPALIFSIKDSNINQISVHQSQLLISTNETTRLFNEHTNEITVIGTKKRRDGYYGSCFFNPNYKPLRLNQSNQHRASQQSFASNSSLNDSDNMLMFVSRPMFRLWQVNNRRSVVFTHQFEPLIKKMHLPKVLEIRNQPYTNDEIDDPEPLLICESEYRPQSDHFQRLIPIYSSTLGNLILSHNEYELFIVDPIGAKLIVRYSQESLILQVSCNENELFVWSLSTNEKGQKLLNVSRLVLLAPTQFVLELHRIHRYLSLMVFVQAYAEMFKQIMALPLSGPGLVTTEGGLLRNVLLNAWMTYNSEGSKNGIEKFQQHYDGFKSIIDDIVEEGRQLRQSIENINDSRLFLTMTNENIDRLCTEPYTSLMSLDISITNLHTNHVIHFSKEALNRHKSVVNLSQSIRNLKKLRQTTASTQDINDPRPDYLVEKQLNDRKDQDLEKTGDTKVIVERQRPIRKKNHVTNQSTSRDGLLINENFKSNLENPISSLDKLDEYKSLNTQVKAPSSAASTLSVETSDTDGNVPGSENESSKPDVDASSPPAEEVDSVRCVGCQWPRHRSHLRPTHSSQQIQYNWIKENLMANFEENVEDIQERAFKHGLWSLYLMCLAHKNELDSYIKCCMLLDDIRLLKVEQFIIKYGEEEIVDRLLQQLNDKIETYRRLKENEKIDDSEVEICLNCHRLLNKVEDELLMTDDGTSLNDISINLINLFQIMMRRNGDIKKSVSRLLKYPTVLNGSKIPATFYLKAIASATLAASRSNLIRI